MTQAARGDGMTGWRRLFASERVLWPRGRTQPRYYLLDAARGGAAFMVLFWHYQHFFTDPNVAVSSGTFAEPQAGYLALVPFAHVFAPLYRFGWAAVPLFWMISGFVFSSVYLGIPTTSRQFVVNRLARLYPLHLLTLCLVAVLQLLAIASFGHSLLYPDNDLYHFVLHLFFASNWGLEGATPYTFNGPVWSVSVEVLIYAVFWLSRRWLTAAGIALPLVLSVASGVLTTALGHGALSQITSCCFYFFLGSSLCGFHAVYAQRPAVVLATAAVVVGIAVAALATRSGAMFVHVAIPALFTALVLVLVIGERIVRTRWRAPLGWIGDNTYGMYLLHVPVQLVIFLCLARSFDIALLARSPWFLLLFLTVVVVLARICFVGFERPMRGRLRRWGDLPRREERPAISAP